MAATEKPVTELTPIQTSTSSLSGKAVAFYDKTSGDAMPFDGDALKTILDTANSAYQKPGTGIPKTDLATAVQTSLGKADSAIQDVSSKEDKSNKVTAFSSPTDTQYPSAKLTKDSLDTKITRYTDAVRGNLAEFDGAGNVIDANMSLLDIPKKDSYNDNMTVAFSGGVYDNDGIGEDVELANTMVSHGDDGIAVIKSIKGKTVAWNQLVPIPSSNLTTTINYVTFTDNRDGSISISGTASEETTFEFNTQLNLTVVGHKYLLGYAPDASPATYDIRIPYVGYTDTSGYLFFTADRVSSVIRILVRNGVQISKKVYFQLFDLTLIFGAGNEPSTVAEFEKYYNAPYYPYDAGTLKSVNPVAYESVSRNVWDEEWELGSINENGVSITSTTTIRSKNYISIISSQTYYINTGNWIRICEYDENHNFIRTAQYAASGNGYMLYFSSNTRFILIAFNGTYGTTYNNDICINLSDPAFNGKYVPHKKSVLNLGLDAIKVKSPNVWDEQWELGNIDYTTGQNEPASDSIRSVGYIPVEPEGQYYFCNKSHGNSTTAIRFRTYNSNKEYVATSGNFYWNTIITIPAGIHYVRFSCLPSYGTTYSNDICINVSQAGINGKYFPHGTLTYNGLRSAGTASDEIVGNKLIKRTNHLLLGDNGWSSSSVEHIFYTSLLGIKEGTTVSGTNAGVVITTLDALGYTRVNKSAANLSNKEYVVGSIFLGGNTFAVRDDSYSTPSSLRAALANVEVDYELATPMEFELADPMNIAYRTWKGGQERVIAEDIVPPFIANIHYGKDYVQETKLKIADFTNRGIAEGIADSISAGTLQEFKYRQSGGDGVNYLKRICGKTLAWNQIVRVPSSSKSSTVTNVVITDNRDGSYKLNGTANGRGSLSLGRVGTCIAGHKYYLRSGTNYTCSISGYSNWSTGTSEVTKSGIRTCSTTYSSGEFSFIFNSGEAYSNAVAWPVCVDLTLLYGSEIDGLTDEQILAKFESEYPGYHPYNAGELKSNDAKAIETVGFNLWGGEWSNKSFLVSDGSVNGAYPDEYHITNYIRVFPSTNYYISHVDGQTPAVCFYDADKNFISSIVHSTIPASHIITSPAGASFVRISLLVEHASAFCFNISDTNKNGTYEPYWKRVINLNLNHFHAIDANGNIVTVNGLKSAGTVHDEIVGNKYIKRVGEMDLGAAYWDYYSDYTFFQTVFPYDVKVSDSVQFTCERYAYGGRKSTTGVAASGTGAYFLESPGYVNLRIKDTSAGTDSNAFKTAMSGVMLYYELATPIEYELVDEIPCAVMVDSLGTERVISPESENGAPSAPMVCYSNYSIGVKKLLDIISNLSS